MEFFGDDSADKQETDPQKVSANELKRLVAMMERLVIAVERIKDDVNKIQKGILK